MRDPFNNYRDAQKWLYSLRNSGSRYGIERMAMLSEALGHPEKGYPLIHVAGTNGKGSVCAMLERVYREGGYRTGLFSSPHLVHQGERIQVNGIPISEEKILSWTNELMPVAQKGVQTDAENHPSFFEWMTAMAFLEFKQCAVDIGILETGLGGRLDSTNVATPEISVVTSVGLDHVEILGNTVEKIAAEKGGIIKDGVPLVLGRMPLGARKVLEDIAQEKGCQVYPVVDRFNDQDLPNTNLEADVQRWNAGVAQLVVETLADKFPIRPGILEKGLHSVQIKGRWSVEMAGSRKVIFDGAHNADALEPLCQNLKQLAAQEGVKPVVVAGFTGTASRAKEMLPKLMGHSRKVILVQPSHDRGLPPGEYLRTGTVGELEVLFPGKGTCTVEPGDATVVVTGSLYLVAEVMERLGGYRSGTGQQGLQD